MRSVVLVRSRESTVSGDIADTIKALSGDKTVLVVAHCFFLKNGKLVDSGTFANLMAQSAEFREMVGHIPEGIARSESNQPGRA